MSSWGDDSHTEPGEHPKASILRQIYIYIYYIFLNLLNPFHVTVFSGNLLHFCVYEKSFSLRLKKLIDFRSISKKII